MNLLGAGGPHCPAPGVSAPLARPLLPLLAAFAAGIALAPRLPPALAGYPSYLLAAAIALCLAFSAARRKKISFLPAAALFVVAGVAAAQATLHPALPANHLSRLHGRQLLLGGRVLAAEEAAGGSHRLLVEVSEARSSRALPVSGRLLLRAWGEGVCPEPGSSIRFPARPQPPRGYANPGCYDLQRRLASEGIFSRASVRLASISVLGRSDAPRLAAVRHNVARFIRERVSGPAGGLCLALALGIRSGLPAEVRDAFARTGAAHLLCVSGLHLGLVGLLAYGLFRRLISRSERLLLRVPAQHLAAALAFAVVLLYALLVGWRTPAVRAAIMVGAALVVLLAGRETDLISALALAALAILALSPTSLLEPSFQLSFSAVAGIGLIAGKLTRLRQRLKLPRPLAWLAGLLVVSAAATLATAPLVAHHFNRVSLIGPAANLLLVPLVGLGLTPLCLVSALLQPISEGLAALPLLVAEPLARAALALVRWLAALPWAAVWVATPDGCEVALIYAALLAVVLLRGRRLVLALAAVAAAWPAYGRLADARANPPGVLSARYLDVGQGNSALVVLPSGEAMLIDAGGYASEGFDPGRRIIARTLWALRVRELERVVVSHSHPDHVAGLPFVLERFRPRELWLADPDPRLARLAKACGCRLVRMRAGQRREVEDVGFEVLWPAAEAVSASGDWDQENELSLVLRLAFGRHAFLFPGDIGRSSELALLESGGSLASDVLLAPHHASARSNCPKFLEAVDCQAVVLSRGPGGHSWPSKDVLERFSQAGAQVWRIDTQGMITAATDGEHLTFKSYLPRQAGGV